MRLHEEPKEAQATSPAPARATAEEFAAAVAALEARGPESGRAEGASSTIDIAEAVRELGLEADPQDVWAEVQGQRARRAGAETRAIRNPVAARKRRRLVGILAAVTAISSGFVIGVLMGARPHQQVASGAGMAIPSVPLSLLSEAPDNVPVYATATDIADLMDKKDPVETLVATSSGFHHRWVLIRHDGGVYLRGYVLPQVAQPGSLSRLSLYSKRAVGELAGARSQAVTIPLNGAHWKDTRGMNDWDEITLTGVQTDGHFHDRW